MTLPNPKILDLSHWNAPADLTKPAIQDWDKARSMGVVGGILRLGSINDVTGVCYEDYRLREYVQKTREKNVPIGYYWYMRPKWGGGRQADYILNLINDLNLPMELDFWIDVEEPGADVNGPGSAPYQARDAILYLATRLLAKYPGRVGIYSRQNLWDVYVASDPHWNELKLWAARWNLSLTGPWSDGYNKFRDWLIWKMWQYSADGNNQAANYGFPSGDADIDLTYYNGTEDDFKREYNLFTSDPLAELTAKVLALETQNANTNSEILKLNSDIANLQAQLDFTNTSLNAFFAEYLELQDWARNVNFKK